MGIILIAILVLGGVALICGLVLALASSVMHVEEDARVLQIKEALPGANCGACGYPGCDGYANAIINGEADVSACPPGGQTVAETIAQIMGVEAASSEAKQAIVQCAGCDTNAKIKMQYEGAGTCVYANQLYSGRQSCNYACLGYGDCKKTCPHHAIEIIHNIAVINPARCVGCKLCLAACPKELIVMKTQKPHAIVACSSTDKAQIVNKHCSKGCIACRKCIKACTQGAITLTDNLAEIDEERCNACGACVTECPRGTIYITEGPVK